MNQTVNNASSSKVGERTCFVTKQVLSRADMLRFVVSPDGRLFFDVSAKLPGRGMWLIPNRDVLEKAVTKKLFSKSAHRSVTIPENFEETVIHQLKEKTLSLLGLCRKAGLTTIGFDKVKEVISAGHCHIAFESKDASDREHNRLFRQDDIFPLYRLFSREELGCALGVSACVYIAVTDGSLARELHRMANKLTDFLNTTSKTKG